MPAFQAPAANKRKLESDEIETSRKRLNTEASQHQAEEVWMVQWRTPQNRKHKTWDGDGVLVVTNQGSGTLYDTDGRIMGTGKAPLPLDDGKSLQIGGKDLELDCAIPKGLFLSGACFGQGIRGDSSSSATHNATTQPVKKFKAPSLVPIKLLSSADKPSSSQNVEPPSAQAVPNREPSDITNFQLHWAATWRKPQGRKNKTWDGDSYVSLVNNNLVMVTEKGKPMGTASWNGQSLQSGLVAHIGGKEVQLDVAIPASRIPSSSKSPFFIENDSSEFVTDEPDMPSSEQTKRFITPASFYASPKPKIRKPRHDPDVPGALVMRAPNKDHIKRFNKRNLPVLPVVVDPILAGKMRPHQREGVQFLYECVMGMRKHEGQGCILADEMGLGKTLQTIALVWTLLRQNPYASPSPAVQKVLIVCPVSLINNWKGEFHKWLGRDRVGIVACDKNNASIDTFGHSKVHEVLIIGYERLRTVVEKLSNIYPPIGLIICDEGHRLKSANNKTTNMFKSLATPRRIILSGTPIQNDLGEFHAMAEFCNPGLLDDYSVFRKVYEVPILKSRAPDATTKEIEIGEGRSAQLLSIAKSFVLRRDAALLKNHLPPKTEYVVFVTPTTLQSTMFSKILNPSQIDDLIQGSTADSLALINVLTKISNSPILLKATADSARGKQDSMSRRTVQEALRYLPGGADVADMSLRKLTVLARILKTLRQSTEEKCVLVSHYTSTLNILEAYCKKRSYSYFRLDGQTPQNKRQDYVNAFNKVNQKSGFIFLLSSKAGGVGINLIGASRLFIIDSDWNPSHDLQSMARCHRDGQKRPVFIYRLLTAGAIDEKIYQRQVTKLGLSDSLMGSGSSSSKSDSFTRKDLRDIFRVHADTPCNTHDLLQCNCDDDISVSEPDPLPSTSGMSKPPERTPSMGFIAASEVTPEDTESAEQARKREGLAALAEWKHLHCLQPDARESIQDDILRKSCLAADSKREDSERSHTLLDRIDLEAIQSLDVPRLKDVPGGTISFVFEKLSTSAKDTEEVLLH